MELQPHIHIGPRGLVGISAVAKDWLKTAAKLVTRKCTSSPPRVWPYRVGDCEFLSCDYSHLSLTFMVTGRTVLPNLEQVHAGDFADVEVVDMSEALALVTILEQAHSRQNWAALEFSIVTKDAQSPVIPANS